MANPQHVNRSFVAPVGDRPKPMAMTLMRGSDDEDGALWRLQVIEDTAFPVHLYIQLDNIPTHPGIPVFHRSRDGEPRVHHWEATLFAVSPGFASDRMIVEACNSCSVDPHYLCNIPDGLFLAALNEALIDYGVRAPLITKSSSRAKGPVRGAAVEATVMSMLIGFVLDRPLNAFGATGWDWLRGDMDGRRSVKKAEGLATRWQAVIDRVNALIPKRYETEDES
jgi:hypothetical protein